MMPCVSRGMNYCSLDDAFQAIGSAPSPGCLKDYSTKESRKEERRKAKKCKGLQMEFLNISEKDPDRQHLNKLEDVPAMNPNTGIKEHVPVDANQGELEPFTPRNDDDPVGDYVRSTLPVNTNTLFNIAPNDCPNKKKYFGADPFADYSPDQKSYRLQPDFLKAFEQVGLSKASTPVLPTPSVDQYWKPITPSGANTAFFNKLPSPGGEYAPDELMKKIDKIFARLDDLQKTSTPEQATSEMLMFISSGVFVLFLLDLLVKKGSTLRF